MIHAILEASPLKDTFVVRVLKIYGNMSVKLSWSKVLEREYNHLGIKLSIGPRSSRRASPPEHTFVKFAALLYVFKLTQGELDAGI